MKGVIMAGAQACDRGLEQVAEAVELMAPLEVDESRRLARVAKALAHPARVAIIQLLASKQTCISGDIAAELPLSRTTVSQHLQELKALDLIRGEIDGLTVCYCLNTELLQRVQSQSLPHG